MNGVKRVLKRRARATQSKLKPRHLNRPALDLGGAAYLSTADAAQRLGLSLEAMRGLIKRKEFPAHVEARRLGRQRRWNWPALDAWMKREDPRKGA